MFIQIHALTGYAGVLLNRDDTGLAKRLAYGDAVRTRTSSQFAKRKVRTADCEFAISDEKLGIAVRSRETFKRCIALPLIADGLESSSVIGAATILMDAVFKPSDKAKKERKETIAKIAAGEAKPVDVLDRGEINVLSKLEIEHLKGLVSKCAAGKDTAGAAAAMTALVADNDFKANLKNVGRAMSLDVAMFGRMVTGDALSSVDAAIHVAHGITVHGQAVETDFFTAVDDLVTGDEDKGGGHLGEVEITSPLLYSYYVVDVRQLMANLEGADNGADVAGAMATNLVHLIAGYIVGAKKGSTAGYSSADLLLIEAGTSQPRTLAEAFRTPCKPNMESAAAALARYLKGKDRMYGNHNERLVSYSDDLGPEFGKQGTVAEMAGATGKLVREFGAAAVGKAA